MKKMMKEDVKFFTVAISFRWFNYPARTLCSCALSGRSNDSVYVTCQNISCDKLLAWVGSF